MSHQDKDETTLKAGVLRWILDQIGIDGRQLMQGPFTLYIRKAAHITEYAILMVLTLRLFILKWSYQETVRYAFIFCIFYAATDEFHQSFIIGRVGTPVDVAIDTIGMLLGFLLWRWMRKRKRFKNSS